MSILTTIDYLNELVKKYAVTADKLITGIKYLQKYGYLVKSGEYTDLTIGEVIQAVRDFQALFGTEVDGEMGTQTLRAMSYPRCGHTDHEAIRGVGEPEQLRAWAKNHLKIWVQTPLTGITKVEWEKLMVGWLNEEAQKVCNLSFDVASSASSADFLISAGEGRKDDFDGLGSVLAWCQLPGERYNDQIIAKFDNAENWLLGKTGNGTLLKNVVLHEVLGHGCGLSHSKFQCLLAPFYNRAIDKPINPDDISQLQARYGKPVSTPIPEPEPDIPPTPLPNDPKRTIITLTGNITGIEIPGFRVSKVGN